MNAVEALHYRQDRYIWAVRPTCMGRVCRLRAFGGAVHENWATKSNCIYPYGY